MRRLAYLIGKMREDLERLENCSGDLRKEVLAMVEEGHDLNMIIIELLDK